MAICEKCDKFFYDDPNTIRMYEGVCDKCSKKLLKKERRKTRIENDLRRMGNRPQR